MGGGSVIEPHPRRHRRNQAPVLERLAVLERGSPEEIVLEQLRLREPTDFQALVGRAGLSADETREVVLASIATGAIVALDGVDAGAARVASNALLVSRTGWDRIGGSARTGIGEHHRAHPLRRGMPREELRTRLAFDGRTFSRVLARLLADQTVRESGPLLALPDHEVRLTPDEQTRVERLLADLLAAGATPPGRSELEARHRLPSEVGQLLIERGELVEVAPDVVYRSDVLGQIVASIVAAIREHGPISVAGVRDLTGTSRKYALAIVAHLDERRITRRVGDDRVLV
jgi:selenocysteine-specific elongation factor